MNHSPLLHHEHEQQNPSMLTILLCCIPIFFTENDGFLYCTKLILMRYYIRPFFLIYLFSLVVARQNEGEELVDSVTEYLGM
jgi:hypothetical protein